MIVKIANDIINHHEGRFPRNFGYWVKKHEMGHKTTALFLWAAFGLHSHVPVDSHVFRSLTKLGWSNAKSPDECAFQAQLWVPLEERIILNDRFGSLGQKLHKRPDAHAELLQIAVTCDANLAPGDRCLVSVINRLKNH